MSTYDATPGATDHTDAFVAAFAAAKELIEDGAANVDILLDSRQEYVLGEAVQSGANGQYAQIPLPFSNADTGKIRLVGRPRGNDIGYLAAGASGTVIRSTITAPAYDAADGIASMFGGPASYCTGHSASAMYPDEWSFIQLGLQDVTLRQETPTLCGIDAGFISGVTVDGLLQFDTDDLANVNPQTLLPGWGGATPSTGPQAIALICPYSLNWFGTRADTIVVSGWTHGVHLGEWARIKELTCFFLSGACIGVDSSQQVSQIGYFTDWNNAYGIADFTPASATPISPTSPYAASQTTSALPATPITIVDWDQQRTAEGDTDAPARVYDLMDANQLVAVDALWTSKDGSTVRLSPVILGAGASLTGQHYRARIKNKLAVAGDSTDPAFPATGVAIRNPYARDAFVKIIGGDVSGVRVNSADDVLIAGNGVVVPANGVITVFYIGTPTWHWLWL
jgi:hypothetical protein